VPVETKRKKDKQWGEKTSTGDHQKAAGPSKQKIPGQNQQRTSSERQSVVGTVKSSQKKNKKKRWEKVADYEKIPKRRSPLEAASDEEGNEESAVGKYGGFSPFYKR